jgi:hypothetical protein
MLQIGITVGEHNEKTDTVINGNKIMIPQKHAEFIFKN